LCHLPVPLGVERPAHGRRLRAALEQVPDDPRDPEPAQPVRHRVAPPCGRGLPPHDRSADRVLQLAALLRAGSARRLDQVMHAVPITATKRLAEYADVIGDERSELLGTLARAATGRT